MTATVDGVDKFYSVVDMFFSGVDKFFSGVGMFFSGFSEILVMVGKTLTGVCTGAANIVDKLETIIKVLVAYHALPQILTFLFLRDVLRQFHN